MIVKHLPSPTLKSTLRDMTNKHYDPEEIAKFEAIASEWWDPKGRFKPLHRINPLRLDYIDERVSISGKQVLDVGCGGGILAESMARRGAIVTGLDRSPKALGVARTHAEQENIALDYVESDAETWGNEHTDAYDVITCLEVLEHVPDVISTVQACAKMVKPNGFFFFATLNRTPISYIKAILGAEYILGWLPKGTHEYAKFIRPSEMKVALDAADLNIQDIRGMSYAMLSDEFTLSHDLSVNYLGVAKKIK